jgi:predicted amidohydrolase YtcJ
MKAVNKTSVQTILTGATVISMEDPVRAEQLDIAIGDGTIAAVGTREEIARLTQAETKIIDVSGRTVMPGLIDSHNHMTLFGHNLEALNLGPSRIGSIRQLLSRLRQRAAETGPGDWIKAWGMDETRLKEGRYPTRAELDQACPHNPLSIMRICMHVMIVNSRAMQLAGICDGTADPPGGQLVRDQDGRPTGVLFELGAMNLVSQVIPNPDVEACANALKMASDVYVSEGITMACEAGAGWTGNPYEVAGFQTAWQRGQLTLRICMGVMESTYNLFPKDRGTGLFSGFGNDALWIGPIKFVADGGIGARTAYMSTAYEGSDYCGVLAEEPQSLKQRMEAAHLAGFQISVHAIGDKTIDIVLGIYEDILLRHPKKDHRHRVEHVSVIRPDFVDRMSRLGLIAVVQPGFLYYLGDSWIANIGPARIENSVAIKTMIENNIMVAASSDRPVTDGNPWYIIWSAVQRKSISGQDLSSSQCIDISQALQLYTVNGAYANFAEDRLGTISPGKYADLIVLDQNPLAIDVQAIKDIRVMKTLIGGKVVFDR